MSLGIENETNNKLSYTIHQILKYVVLKNDCIQINKCINFLFCVKSMILLHGIKSCHTPFSQKIYNLVARDIQDKNSYDTDDQRNKQIHKETAAKQLWNGKDWCLYRVLGGKNVGLKSKTVADVR